MADKPSRGLVLYGDGLARFLNTSHTHLHSLASRSSCGFLSLPHVPPSENVDARTVAEFLNLVDAYEDSITLSKESLDECITATLSERFMAVRAALITKNTSLKTCGSKLGLGHVDSPGNLVAAELLKLLGFEGEKVLETSEFDLVFVHVSDDLECVDSLVGEMISKSEIASRLHLSVVLSYGDISKDDESVFSISKTGRITHPLYPRQSYTIKGSNPRSNVRDYCPMLIAQWQDGVTRKDMVESFSFQDFMENAGNLVIPADRFLHEVAFKLWKAPKYGA